MACRDSWAANAIRQAYELLTFYPELAQELGKHATIVLASLRLVENAPSKINLQYIISKRIHAILTLVLKLFIYFFFFNRSYGALCLFLVSVSLLSPTVDEVLAEKSEKYESRVEGLDG